MKTWNEAPPSWHNIQLFMESLFFVGDILLPLLILNDWECISKHFKILYISNYNYLIAFIQHDHIFNHQLSGHEFEQTSGDSREQRILACYSPWGHKSHLATE